MHLTYSGIVGTFEHSGKDAVLMTHRRMMWLGAVLAGGFVVLTAGGCDQSAKDREALLREEASTLRMQLDDQKRNARTLQQQNDQLKLRNQQLESDLVSTTPVEPTVATIGGFQAESRGGEIVVNLPSDVLFDPGRDTLKSTAKSSLNAVVSDIKSSYPNKEIRLVGYTDSDPIQKSKERYETNHHLGFERAYSVGEYMQTRGIPAKQISYASYGPHQPKTSKAQSRRVELVVVVDE
jgi:outer membrane protein OmpA-like peptidoglycan-associated protein